MFIKKNTHKIFNLPTLAVVIVVDQMLLPMFHIGDIPFKPSYLVLVAWPLFASKTTIKDCFAVDHKRRFLRMTVPIMGILGCGLLGQLCLWTLGDIHNHYLAFRAVMTYVLMVLAFGFGQSVPEFRSRWLLWILYANLAINFLFIFAGQKISAISRFYYYAETAELKMAVSTIRPTGIFSNPNATMLIINILLLFVVVSARLGYLGRRTKVYLVLATIASIIMAFLLASRNQIIVSLLLLAVLIGAIYKSHLIKLGITVITIIGMVVVFNSLANIRGKHSFIDHSFRRFEFFNPFDLEGPMSANILRPIYAWERFRDRFVVSPIIGSGFSTLEQYPFDRDPGFHNDWYRIWATSGMLGGMFMLLLMYRIYKRLGLLVLIPFVLPGLTNTFLCNIPAVIVFFFMLGVLIERRAKIKNYR